MFVGEMNRKDQSPGLPALSLELFPQHQEALTQWFLSSESSSYLDSSLKHRLRGLSPGPESLLV